MIKPFTSLFQGASLALLMALPMAAPAQDTAQGTATQIVVEKPWARASIGTSRPGGAYLTVQNTGDAPVTLVGLRAEIAGMAAIHETTTNAEGVSSMGPAGDITIPPGGSVALEPGGYHAMLMQLQAPLVKGETFPLTLLFSDGSELEVSVPVLGPGARGPEG